MGSWQGCEKCCDGREMSAQKAVDHRLLEGAARLGSMPAEAQC